MRNRSFLMTLGNGFARALHILRPRPCIPMNYEPPEQPSFSTHWRTRVSGGRPVLRLRVGPWLVIFERDEEARNIDVLRIGPRGDVYKELGGTP